MSKTSIADVLEAIERVRELKTIVAVHEEAVERILERLDAIEQRLDTAPKRRR